MIFITLICIRPRYAIFRPYSFIKHDIDTPQKKHKKNKNNNNPKPARVLFYVCPGVLPVFFLIVNNKIILNN